MKANLQSVLTDCTRAGYGEGAGGGCVLLSSSDSAGPHRERLGWLEASHLLFPALAYNFDVSRLWAKIALDTVDSQLPSGMVPDIAPEYTVFAGGFRDSPEWGSAAVLNPYWLYEWYGNAAVLNETYATAVAYVDYLLTRRTPACTLDYGLGDWIPVVPSPPGVTATAILVQDLDALAVTAAALGHAAAAANYTALSRAVAAAYQAAFGGASGGAYPTQCAAGMALTLGITPAAAVAAARAYMVDDVSERGACGGAAVRVSRRAMRGGRAGNVTTSGEIGNRYALLALADVPGGGGIAAVWASLLRTDSPGVEGGLWRSGAAGTLP